VIASSPIASKYATAINRESAYEILQRKLEASAAAEPDPVEEQLAPEAESDDFDWRKGKVAPRARRSSPSPAARPSSRRPPKTFVEEALGSRMAQNVARQATRTVTREVTRGVMGILKGLF
jgi:hypothetical protein